MPAAMKVAQQNTLLALANPMDVQQRSTRGRQTSVQFELPRTTIQSPVLEMAYQRNLSPGARRIVNPGTTSANASLQDPYRYERHNSYTSPRTSNGAIPGVVPISTQTFVNVPPPQRSAGYDGYQNRPTTDIYSGRPLEQPSSSAYTGRPRRSSLVDQQRGQPSSSTTQMPSRSRPTVVQQDYNRPSSPQKGSRDKDYYITPASSKEPRKVEHKKLYTVNDGSANLVADVDVPAGGERHHKRRESFNGHDRGGYRTSEKDRDRRGYHLNGTNSNRTRDRERDRPVVDEEDYGYTDAAGMYRDTEPAARPSGARRERRGSVDRGGATSRERPVSMIEPSRDLRNLNQPIGAGPPPSTRGWSHVNDMGRANSVRERGRAVPQSPSRAPRVPQSPTRGPRVPQSPTRGRYPETGGYPDSRDPYYVPPRRNSMDRGLTVPNDRYDRHDRDDRKEPRQRGRRDSMTRANDRSVERRGFGIRPESKDRFGRGSDESFERQKQYRDSGYAVPEPHRRDTAPELNYHEERRMEQEKRDRVLAQQIQDAERERAERETRDREQRDREIPEPRRREEDRNYDRGYDRGYDREHDRPRERDYDHDVDRERERERQRMMEPQPPQQPQQPRHEPHHHRRESNRDFPQDYSRKENGQREGSETQAQPGLSSAATAATAGLAGAAATFGLGKVFGKDKDKDDRDNDKPRDRDRDGDRDSDRERKREKRRERERDSDRGYDGPRDAERERRSPRFDVPPQERRSDEGVHFQQDRHGGSDAVDQGLGFAFERAREPPRSGTAPPAPAHDRAPPVAHRDDQPALNRERPAERDTERDHDKYFAEAPKPSGDADEDYRRRMEQVQRELGVKGVEERASDSDPDRERRRREREQRRNERRDMQNANGVDPGPRNPNSAFAQYPEPGSSQRNYEDRDFDDRGSDNRSFENRSFENRSFENDSVNGSTASRPSGLTRKRSILDQPMNDEPVQIIDNSMSERRENRVRIVDPPTEEEDKKPRGILKRPTDKFPETANVMREGVAPLKDATKKGIPPGARWTKIDRRLVNPESLEEAKERFEERADCVIVLRVLTKEEIQKFADKTKIIRDKREAEIREQEERSSRLSSRHRSRDDRNRERRANDEYEDENSEDEFKPRAPRMLALPGADAQAGGSEPQADFRERRDRDRDRERERERDGSYVSSRAGRRDERETPRRDDRESEY